MKRVALLVDAAADLPFPELQDQTPLQRARQPYARRLAAAGACGALRRMRPEVDASRALLAELCGVSSEEARALRWGPMAAAALGLPLDGARLYLLGEFISVDEQNLQGPVAPSSLEEQEHVLRDLDKALSEVDRGEVHLHGLTRGHFVMELSGGRSTFPVSQVEFEHSGFLKRVPTRLRKLLEAAERCLSAHPVNQIRLDLGEAPLDGLWCWSGGREVPIPDSPPFSQVLMSPERLVEGMARQWNRAFMPMPDPYSLNQPDAGFDVGKMLRLLEKHDEVVIWIPAPFSGSRFEGPEEKVRRLDAIDYYVTGPVQAILEEMESSRLLLLAAGVRHRGRPERGAAPFVLWGDGISPDACPAWTETDGMEGALAALSFQHLLEHFRNTI
ncbi:MAG: hypothetical protein PF795_08215 [Kiritimatiellae bacterium]|jgi:2,3-bisphosphoglycerate-independent phosphoglycerate mutase|nr:hypothetical protein [Kiritimatiellia bacterium]